MTRSGCRCARQPQGGLPCTESPAGVAQSAEQPSCKRQASGSNPLTGSQPKCGFTNLRSSSAHSPGFGACGGRRGKSTNRRRLTVRLPPAISAGPLQLGGFGEPPCEWPGHGAGRRALRASQSRRPRDLNRHVHAAARRGKHQPCGRRYPHRSPSEDGDRSVPPLSQEGQSRQLGSDDPAHLCSQQCSQGSDDGRQGCTATPRREQRLLPDLDRSANL
jgi:hypothetical protein